MLVSVEPKGQTWHMSISCLLGSTKDMVAMHMAYPIDIPKGRPVECGEK